MTKKELLTLTPAKAKEWRGWGKDAYKSCASMMRSNAGHPDYDTREKCETIHDENEAGKGQSAHHWTKEGRTRLRTRWGYSNEAIEQARTAWLDGYGASRKWYAREDAKQQIVIDKYVPIFNEASKIAHAVDVSDIKDGFPCGSVHLYLQRYAEAEDLYKALGHFDNSSVEAYKRKLPIKMPSYGQCISYDEKICAEVNEFLRSKGVFASVYSWID
ncbi:MAG TPA: hypothetical protein ENH85_03405 [Candidatus Scalindua sp.]|nr:hypothetical protein [Candidatus Scalindua sp.]